MLSLKTYLVNLNLFEKKSNSNQEENAEQHRINRIASRIYLLMLIIIMIVVAIVLRLRTQTRVITIQQPTMEQFMTLPTDAQCPCSRISLRYNEFIELNTSFHPVCSSDFVLDRWIQTTNFGSQSSGLYFSDFRIMASAQFQALAGFCRLSKENMVQGISSFKKNSLISFKLLPEDIFRSQTRSSIEQFQTTFPNTFRIQLQLLRQITFDNQLISGLLTNFRMIYSLAGSPHLRKETSTYMKLDGNVCACSTDINCVSLSHFHLDYEQVWIMTVPGVLSGCLPVNALLFSTLECFYNQSCVDEVVSFYHTRQKFTAIPTLEKRRYPLNSTVQSMIDQFMIERWMIDTSYEKYYSQCAPISCTYSKSERHTFVFILTKIISLLGGLTLLLKFIISLAIKLIRRLQQRNQNTVRITCKCI